MMVYCKIAIFRVVGKVKIQKFSVVTSFTVDLMSN